MFASFIEIYQDSIRDLLALNARGRGCTAAGSRAAAATAPAGGITPGDGTITYREPGAQRDLLLIGAFRRNAEACCYPGCW